MGAHGAHGCEGVQLILLAMISKKRARILKNVQGVLEGVCTFFRFLARNSLIVHVFGQKKSENVQRIPAIIGCYFHHYNYYTRLGKEAR